MKSAGGVFPFGVQVHSASIKSSKRVVHPLNQPARFQACGCPGQVFMVRDWRQPSDPVGSWWWGGGVIDEERVHRDPGSTRSGCVASCAAQDVTDVQDQF